MGKSSKILFTVIVSVLMFSGGIIAGLQTSFLPAYAAPDKTLESECAKKEKANDIDHFFCVAISGLQQAFGEAGSGIQQIIDLLTNPNFGLEEIKNEVSTIESEVLSEEHGLAEIKKEVRDIETRLASMQEQLDQIQESLQSCDNICDDLNPVCGTDGETYSCAGEARCNGVEILHSGSCGPSCQSDNDCQIGEVCGPTSSTCESCQCTDVFAPVCGVDGSTYSNACEARCAHVQVAHDGECVVDVVTFAGFARNSAGSELHTSVWNFAGQIGVAAGNEMCEAIGADHVCSYEELLLAESKGELSGLPDMTTSATTNGGFWLHRLTPVNVGGTVYAPGAGGRCNDWTFPGNHIADGEFGEIINGELVFHFDQNACYTGNAVDGCQGEGPLDGGLCGGVGRSILCCYPMP